MPHSLALTMISGRRHGRPAGRKAWPAMTALLLLAGCAGAKVEHVTRAPMHAPVPPGSLVVDVALSPELGSDPGAARAALALEADLIKRYRRAGLPARPAAGAPPVLGAAILHLRISRVDPGNRAERLIVGFGAGRSTLRTDASLQVTGEETPALAFSSSADSGRKPGLILPGGIAAATGDLTHLAIGGGLDLLLTGQSGLQREADQTAKAIVLQIRRLYRYSGWVWPG